MLATNGRGFTKWQYVAFCRPAFNGGEGKRIIHWSADSR
jgi:hypothetical protein